MKAAHSADIAPTKPAGYSGKSLLEKLGFKPPLALLAIGTPPEYRAWLGELPQGIRIVFARTRCRWASWT